MSSDAQIVVVGAGPAGLMAAETLARAGNRVVVFDHKRAPGRKFVLAGRSGLNLTHSEDLADLLARYAGAPQLLDAIRSFDSDAVRSWCDGLGEPPVVGSTGRVFPQSTRATPLLRAWLSRLEGLGVTLRTGQRFESLSSDRHLTIADTGTGRRETVSAQAIIFALGGASWPGTGSTGEWVSAFTDAGIRTTALAAANCGVRLDWTDHFGPRFAGTPLKGAKLSIGSTASRGDPVVTTTGLESGPVYTVSAAIRDEIRSAGSARVDIDLQPDRDHQRLEQHLEQRRRPADSSSTWLRRAGLAPVAVGLLREATANALPRDAAPMAALIKRVPLTVTALQPIDRAISTAGGVDWLEVDDHFMLRKAPGAFVAGEMLDWDAPTGGYLLQACLSTGVAAANGAMRWLSSGPAARTTS